jgi:hypothetical protein
VLRDLDPGYAKSLAENGRVFVPAARAQRESWLPDAEQTGARDIPLLIVADPVERLCADLADAVVDVRQGELPGSREPYAGRSVALLNRGTPSHVAEPDGTLCLSLMRSCTAWPSGVWLDGERRTAPDGSGFQLQHWSHTFEYALVAGAPDWRAAGFVRAGQEYNHGLIVRRAGAGSGAAALPPVASLASVQPESVLLSALKARGNPYAAGRTDVGADAAEGLITARVYESSGRAVRARLRLRTGIAAADRTNLLEQGVREELTVGAGGVAELPLGPAEVATVALAPAGALVEGGVDAVRPGPTAEPVQPVPTRYWLHNRGPAPLGNLPVSVHLSHAGEAAGGDTGADADGAAHRVRLTVSASAEPAAGTVELVVPDGLELLDAPALGFDLASGGHAEFALRLRRTLPGGPYHLAARITDPLGQTLEDVLGFGENSAQAPFLVEGPEAVPEPLRVAPGGCGHFRLRITVPAGSPVRGEAQLCSPFGTWGPGADLLVDPWAQGFDAASDAPAELRWTVSAPPGARPGARIWAVVRVAAYGSVHYAATVPLEVASPEG